MKRLPDSTFFIGPKETQYHPFIGKLLSGMRGKLVQIYQLRKSIMSGSKAAEIAYQHRLKLRIYTLWDMQVFDTLQIAQQLKIKEHTVYNAIAEMRDGRKTQSPE